MTDKNNAPSPSQRPDDSRYHSLDPIFAELCAMHCDAIWVSSYLGDFRRLRETDPEFAENELRYLGETIAESNRHVDGLTAFVLAGETIDTSKSMPPAFTGILGPHEAKLFNPALMSLRPRQPVPDPGPPRRPLIDPAAVPPPGEGLHDCRDKDIDALAFALERVRCYTMWWGEHHRSFLTLRESDPIGAEDELEYLKIAIADIKPYRDRLTELLLAGYTIDPSKRMPDGLDDLL